jgi:hypothetical protein
MDFSFSCDLGGGLSWTREFYRLGGGTAPVRLHQDLVGHAADWRAALSYSVTAYAPYWEPENVDSFLMAAGTGSYSSFLGPFNESEFDAMGYAVNWDLGGKFFPYMGMFLPPVGPDTAWECDPEGSQPKLNVTFGLIGTNYRAMWEAGYTDVSYFNVNEYGLNVVLPPNSSGGDQANVAQPPAAITRPGFASKENLRGMVRRELGLPGGSPSTCQNDWQNASACLLSDLLPALVTRAYNTDSRRLVHGPWYSWQNAVVIDPGVEEYHAFMIEQMVRHVVHEDAFAGVAVDRSDWQDLYNCALDDGVSFVPEAVEPGVPMSGVCSSMRITYAAMISDLRAAITLVPGLVAEERAGAGMPRGAAPVGMGILLLNRYGNGRLDQYRHYDGLFSEGMAVNGAGLIAVSTPGVLWTYDWTSCCSDETRARAYFQAHLFMGLCPMLPFPGNDHAIAPNASAAAFYAVYAPLLRAVAPKVWLLEAHVVAVVNGSSGTGYAKVNAFVTPVLSPAQEAAGRIALGAGGSGVGGAAPTEQAITLAVVFASDPSGVVTLHLTGIDRAWRSPHPLLRAHRAMGGVLLDAHGEGAGAVYTAEVLWPGQGWAWAPLASFSTPSTLLQVPVVQGAAVVRIRAAPSP